MANPTPRAGNILGKLRDMERRLNDRIDRRAGFDGSQLTRTVQKLEELISGLLSQVNGIFTGYVQAGTTITAGGDITAGGNITTGASGSLYSTYGRATPVVSSYVSAWFNADGRLGATASSMNVKQDFRPADMSALVEALRTVALVEFRRIEAVKMYGDDAPVEKGGIVEYFISHGLGEYCFFHPETGEPQGINYELLTIPLIACFQSIDARLAAAGI